MLFSSGVQDGCSMLNLYYGFVDVRRNLGLFRALVVSLQWAFRREFLLLVRTVDKAAIPPGEDEAIEWRYLSDDDIPDVLRVNRLLNGDEIRRRRAEGQECELAYIDGVLAHYIWRTAGPAYLPYLGKTCRVAESDFLITELFTAPGFRKRGIHANSVARTSARARQLGMRRCYSLVAWWNTPVLRTAYKTGASVAGTVGYWQIGCCRRYFARGAVGLSGDLATLG